MRLPMQTLVWTGLTALLLSACAAGGMHHPTALPEPAGYNAHFPDMDADGDELVSWEEFKAYFPDAQPAVYEALDLNADGGVDHEEWHEFKQAHGLGHHG